jgi:hypothetical protein
MKANAYPALKTVMLAFMENVLHVLIPISSMQQELVNNHVLLELTLMHLQEHALHV